MQCPDDYHNIFLVVWCVSMTDIVIHPLPHPPLARECWGGSQILRSLHEIRCFCWNCIPIDTSHCKLVQIIFTSFSNSIICYVREYTSIKIARKIYGDNSSWKRKFPYSQTLKLNLFYMLTIWDFLPCTHILNYTYFNTIVQLAHSSRVNHRLLLKW